MLKGGELLTIWVSNSLFLSYSDKICTHVQGIKINLPWIGSLCQARVYENEFQVQQLIFNS
jgi:hypothetical protein